MALTMHTIGRLMSRYSRRFGDPTGTLRIEFPNAVTPVGHHPFLQQKSEARTEHVFERVRGGWKQVTERDPDGLGREESKTGACVLYHDEVRMTHAELSALLDKPGAALFWNGEPISLNGGSVQDEDWQGATVFQFSAVDRG